MAQTQTRLLVALIAGSTLFLATCTGPFHADGPEDALPKLLENLGPQKHPITTKSEWAQKYFDQGMILAFGFNHDAAFKSFEAAAHLDPDCAMCFWGQAWVLGPNINAPMGPEAAARAYTLSQEAVRLAPGASPKERQYIEALATRYAAEEPEDRSSLDESFAFAMRVVRNEHPEDVDAAVIAAESLMDLYPWAYWNPDETPREHTLEIMAVLEDAMAAEPLHVGANHYYIHAVEEYFPENAEPAADRLGDVAPDAGHLVHMPSHIYWRVGRYNDAAEINKRAAASDEAYFAWCRPGAFYRALYYPHNVHFLWAAAAAEGQSQLALTTSRKLAAKSTGLLAEFPFLEEFMTVPVLTLVRFGRFDEVLGEPKPAEGQAYLTGIWHYARGIAQLRKGDLAAAKTELGAVETLAAGDTAKALIVAGGVASAGSLLEIGASHLRGEIAAAEGRTAEAVAALEDAVARQDAVPYMEPPPWYMPSRQALGAILLDAGRASDAEAVYRKDLEQYPKNGWSLFGLSESLFAQGKTAEADWAAKGFANAFARADVELQASRF